MPRQKPADTDNTISGGIFYGPVLQGRDVQATFHLPAAAPVALAQLPAATAGFTGREDEMAVLAGLLDPAGTSGPVVVSAVAGLAGVGKTTLAVQAGHAARERGWFGGGVLFIDLHGYDEAPVQPEQALDALLRALGLPAEHIPPAVEERAGLYRSVLAQISDPVLVIADNASTETQVRLLLPSTGPHKVLATSRHTLAGLGARLVDVTILDEEAGVELLDEALRLARPKDDRISGDQESAERLAGLCGGLPLALQITAALLNADPVCSARELADELADERSRLERLRYGDGGDGRSVSVEAAFELSYRRLHGGPARLFRMLPLNPGPDLSTDSAAVLADQRFYDVRKSLSYLARAHMIETAPSAPGRWRMHDLMRLYAQRLSDSYADSDGRDKARDRLLSYYLTMTAAANDLRALAGTAVRREFRSRDSALAWLHTERVNLVASVIMAADTGRDQAAIQLSAALAEYLSTERYLDDLLATTLTGRDIAQRLGDKGVEGTALCNLGGAMNMVRRFEEAIPTLEAAATTCRESGNHYGEGMALNNLAQALLELGRPEEAITALEAAATTFGKIGNLSTQLMVLNNLGPAMAQVGRFEEAITALEAAATTCRESGNLYREGQVRCNLGAVLMEQGRFEEAITALEAAATTCRESGNLYHEGAALNNLGAALYERGQLEEAITAHQDAAALYRETGDRHDEAKALTNLGLALHNLQRFEEATTAYQEAAAICKETGDRHDEASTLYDLGVALYELGQFEEATTAYQEAAAIYKETGDRHDEAKTLTNLGVALYKLGRFEEAITAHQEAAAIFRETGDRHGEAKTLINLGAALYDARQFESAMAACQKAAAISRDMADQDGEGTALDSLGRILVEMGNFEEAITAHQEAAALFRETGDEDRERVALDNLKAANAVRRA
jgi:tetratricopeptide (TPR) repeat protein